MADFVPYVLLAAGIALVVQFVMLNAVGMFNFLMFRLLPGVIGIVCLWASAVTFIGGGL